MKEIETISLDNLLVIEERRELLVTSKMGRPIKFKDPIIFKVNIGFTQKQLNSIECRMKELKQKVRLDYIRNLIAKDIEDFEF